MSWGPSAAVAGGDVKGGRPSGRTLQHALAALFAEAELPGKNPRRRSRKGLLTQANHPTKQQTIRVNFKLGRDRLETALRVQRWENFRVLWSLDSSPPTLPKFKVARFTRARFHL